MYTNSIPLGYTIADTLSTPIGFISDAGSLTQTFSAMDTLNYTGDAHLATFASTGSGKLTGAIGPTLVTYAGSAVVMDNKGELVHTTARARREMGHLPGPPGDGA